MLYVYVLYIVVCPFSFGYRMVCPSLIYRFSLPFWYLHTLLMTTIVLVGTVLLIFVVFCVLFLYFICFRSVPKCCLCQWIVPSWLPIRFSLTFNYNNAAHPIMYYTYNIRLHAYPIFYLLFFYFINFYLFVCLIVFFCFVFCFLLIIFLFSC